MTQEIDFWMFIRQFYSELSQITTYSKLTKTQIYSQLHEFFLKIFTATLLDYLYH
jgi:hypothetical protein